jgi:predicted glycoside hydrolase/deacetylase ChbG (UPF0249 family)
MSSSSGEKLLIFNADDFGQTAGITRGIVECHQRGVVTSTSLMVTGKAVEEAIAASKENPNLSIGLHFDVCGEDEREFDTSNVDAVREEFFRQFTQFEKLMRRTPTHIDSHRHVHRDEHLFPHFVDWVSPMKIPLRGSGEVNFVGGFYGQWEWKVTELRYVGVEFLQEMLRNEMPVGVTEFSCHPGYITADYVGVYREEREAEIKTLTDPRVRETIEAEKIRLVNYSQYAMR